MKNKDIEPQELIDIMFQIGLSIHINRTFFEGKSQDEVAAWIRTQLNGCDIPVIELGSSYGYLIDNKEDKIEMNYPRASPGVSLILQSTVD